VLSRARYLTELSEQLPGIVLVFEVGSGFVAFTERRHLADRKDLVAKAVSVSLVDVRPHTVDVTLNLPSQDPAEEFGVLVDFHCQVTEPGQVAATGLRDLTSTLRHYLRQNPALIQLTATRSIEQINQVRLEITSQIEAFYRLRAPRVPGMSIELLNIRVVMPSNLADHDRRMRDERWRQDHEGLAYDDGEDWNASRMRGNFEAGATTVDDKRHELIELWKSLPEAYQDTVAVDAQSIVDSMFHQGLGSHMTRLDVDAEAAVAGVHTQKPLGDSAPSTSAHFLSVSIYLSDERSSASVEAAVEAAVSQSELFIIERDDPIFGSYFRRMRATFRRMLASEVGSVVTHAVDSILIAQDAHVTSTMLQHLGPVISALQSTKDAVVRIGAVLIVKIDERLVVHQLTAKQQLQLDHQPELAMNPGKILLALELEAGTVRDTRT
jgi:hypothetical protein